MKKLLKIIGAVVLLFIVLTIAITIFYRPDKTLSVNNPKDGIEITEDHVLVEGKYTGIGGEILINGEVANRDTSKQTFSKDIKLKDGDNLIKVEYKDSANVITSQEVKVYFDLEGMLYLQKEKNLSKVPQYELVRKENIENGFTAIVYAAVENNELNNIPISNLSKDLKGKYPNEKTISILIFTNSDKPEVEKALENTDPNAGLQTVSSKVIATYDRRDGKEMLFKYPSGLTGDKLALEI